MFDTKVKLAVTDELVARVEQVRELRDARLGLRPPAADVYREALALGLVQLLDAEAKDGGDRRHSPSTDKSSKLP